MGALEEGRSLSLSLFFLRRTTNKSAQAEARDELQDQMRHLRLPCNNCMGRMGHTYGTG